ncbi:MAG: isoprenylcysteine carboxyl methyltransferase [Gammaproteobacteria bacterium RIFCSPLOWO2_02_FULL_47_50]|jgi:protein-S-isoprenylcysteine O-methyltransferase Ste14|nr:MAG: isoprenylcysteine carboxyl methyltransferase [Gammaproteobacteria bacterium RIFCSPLOWO2_01_FULL_47_190]OGT74234.1 MAG: isoprenylcysteine carboxyl methyltransferase [Gammaproteobacteria bacterium RIFCSPLOWO2_12_47_11]OGT79127.1 MAG: isoprenylcysteine carboxyl methyltransferase [Gammaproteobacteria bacterium RIFCSPLOWO2_02_FULL_47_50]
MEHGSAYGLWSLVIINSAIFIIFAFSFAKPQTSRDWRSLGVFSAFIVALFTEMYGFPLTIYLLSGWLATNYPGIDFLSHDSGHLWHTLFRMKGNAHFDFLHILSNIAIFGGFWLLASAWNVLYKAQQSGTLATSGAYSYLRHPQYLAFIIIMLGFLLQWPTLPTLIMFPVLVYFYVRLAKREEREALVMFEEEYNNYMRNIPGFIPRILSKQTSASRSSR